MSILNKISHQNIIKLYESFNDENYLYIVMQYANKGDLHNVLMLDMIDFEEEEDQER